MPPKASHEKRFFGGRSSSIDSVELRESRESKEPRVVRDGELRSDAAKKTPCPKEVVMGFELSKGSVDRLWRETRCNPYAPRS